MPPTIDDDALRAHLDALLVKLRGHAAEPARFALDLATLMASADEIIDGAELDLLEALYHHVYAKEPRASDAGEGLAGLRTTIKGSVRTMRLVGAQTFGEGLGATLRKADAAREGLALALAMARASGSVSAEEWAVVLSIARGAKVPPSELPSPT